MENIVENTENVVVQDAVVEENKFVCKVCKKVFTHQSSHSRHQSVCGQQKSRKCEECGKTFARNDVLKRHQKTCKTKPTEFFCDTCPKSYDQQWKLTRHKKSCPPPPQSNTLLTPRTVKCCGKSFTSSSINAHRNRCHLKSQYGVFEGDVFTGDIPQPIDEPSSDTERTLEPMIVDDCPLVFDIDANFTAIVSANASEAIMYTEVVG